MRITQSLPVVFLLAVILATRLFFFFDAHHFYKGGEFYKKTYRFDQEPKKNDMSQYFFADGILVSVPLYPHYKYGETVEISGVITNLKSEKGDLLTIENPTLVKKEQRNPVISVSIFVRKKIQDIVMTTIPQREGGLLLGIILGVRDKIDKDFYGQLKDAGVLHIIAASGQNVSILASILLLSLQRIVKRRYALLFTSLGILFYVVLAGFDPPILRASIMALVAYGAMALGRQSIGIWGLFISGWGMVFWNPLMISDVSFQLSFLSTFGIMTLKPLLDRVVTIRLLDFIKDDITTTISAQIATFPLMAAAFGSYSLLSFPINILLLWTVPMLMIFGGIGALFSLIMPILAQPFILLCYPFLYYFTTLIDLADRFYIGIPFTTVPQTLIAGYYLILIAIVIRFKYRRRKTI
jgi:competence protein ComEC